MTAECDIRQTLSGLGIDTLNPGATDGKHWFAHGPETDVISPVNGRVVAKVRQADKNDYERVVQGAEEAFDIWRRIPAPKRGDVVRQLGEKLRRKKEPLGKLVTLEMGKSIQEGWGEVQEMIDICDYACGQSRMLYGVTTHSERPMHRLFEQWHPLGVVGIISAFNFPVAVWSWNTAIALVCGDTVLWKPASATPLSAIACQKLLAETLKENGMPPGVSTLVAGKGSEVGDTLIRDPRVKLVSYTGSTAVGRRVAEAVAGRLGKSILELGGNNAVIVTAKADLKLAASNVFFGAVGTAGQRCTTTRRVIVEDRVYKPFIKLLSSHYKKLTIGDPMGSSNQMGPLVNIRAVDDMMGALETVRSQGGKVLFGGKRLKGDRYPGGCYVTPAVVEVRFDLPIVREETFAPILYLIRYKGDVNRAIEINNSVSQGLSSSIFTNDLIEAETFLGHDGSDCGIANVNLGTSGAEIGLAFGGEKDTGGGRESGSDAWKSYMRRQTNTINWSGGTALAQGIRFE